MEERADDDGGVRYLIGEFPDNLALVIEKGTAEFEIGETVEEEKNCLLKDLSFYQH